MAWRCGDSEDKENLEKSKSRCCSKSLSRRQRSGVERERRSCLLSILMPHKHALIVTKACFAHNQNMAGLPEWFILVVPKDTS